jgi:hypothetical protein
LSTDPYNVKRQARTAIGKKVTRYNTLPANHPDFEPLRKQILSTQYGCNRLGLPFSPATHAVEIVETLRDEVLPGYGKHLRGDVVSKLCKKPTGGVCKAKAAALGLDCQEVRDATWHEQEAQQTNQDGTPKRGRTAKHTLAQNYAPNVTHAALPKYVEDMYVKFFMRASYLPSGANNNLRHVSVLKHELEEELYAVYPAMLRELNEEHGSDIFDHQDRASNDTYTVLQANILTAMHLASKDGFTDEQEVTSRRDFAIAKYRHTLNRSCWVRRGHAMGQKQPSGPVPTDHLRKKATWNPDAFPSIKPIDPAHFWKVLDRRKVRWTFNINETVCESHQNGPGQVAAHKKLTEQIADLMLDGVDATNPKMRALVREQDIMKAHVDLYNIHLEQFQKCRPYIKDLESRLVPGQCVVYRDFVNQHNHLGNKVVNLILTKLWRDKIDGEVKVLKIHNVITDKATKGTTCAVMADVLDFHFKPEGKHANGYFDDVEIVYLCGDHGSHFASTTTYWNESNAYKKYKKMIFPVFLCPYHGYNRCDGAGVQLKRLAEQANRNGKGPVVAKDYQLLMNTSAHIDSVCCYIPIVNRPLDVHTIKFNSSEGSIAKRYCEIRYTFINAANQMAMRAGIYLARLVPGEGAFDVVDMIQRSTNELCSKCSDRLQRPETHGDQPCPSTQEELVDRSNVVGPDPIRLDVPQWSKQWHKANKIVDQARREEGKVVKPPGEFPCKVPDCRKNQYKTVRGCNNHILAVHVNKDITKEAAKQYMYEDSRLPPKGAVLNANDSSLVQASVPEGANESSMVQASVPEDALLDANESSMVQASVPEQPYDARRLANIADNSQAMERIMGGSFINMARAPPIKKKRKKPSKPVSEVNTRSPRPRRSTAGNVCYKEVDETIYQSTNPDRGDPADDGDPAGDPTDDLQEDPLEDSLLGSVVAISGNEKVPWIALVTSVPCADTIKVSWMLGSGAGNWVVNYCTGSKSKPEIETQTQRQDNMLGVVVSKAPLHNQPVYISKQQWKQFMEGHKLKTK